MGYPTVTADTAFKVLHDSHLHELAAGQVVQGELAAYLAAAGAPVTVTATGDDDAPAKPVEKMNAKELKAYADSLEGLDLGGAKTKPEVLAAVTAHLEAGAPPADDSQSGVDDVPGDAGDAGVDGADGVTGDAS